MKKLFALILFASCCAVHAETPIKNLRVSGTFNIPPSTPVPSSDIDWSKATTHYKTLAANTTFTFSNTSNTRPPIEVAVTNTASNYTVTWPTTVIWEAGVAPTQTIGAKTDIYTFKKIGAQIYGSVRQNYTNATPTATATSTATATATSTPTASPSPTSTATATTTPTATATATATATPTAFAPSDISGLKLWLKADGQSFSNNDPVDTWVDSSGTSNNATQATSGKRPTYKTNIQNSLPIVRFDGTDDILLTANELPNTATVFVVCTLRGSAPANSDLIIANSGDATGGILIWASTNSSSNWGGLDTSFVTKNAGEDLVIGTFSALELTTTSGALAFYRNGTLKVSGTSRSYGGPGPSSSLGANAADSNFTEVDIGEVIVYDTVLSSGNRMAVEAYLVAKWNY